jgi:hypothetical protein
MYVSNLSRSLETTLEIVWPRRCADRIYNFDDIGIPRGESIDVGDAFHRNFSRFLKDQWVPKEYLSTCIALGLVIDDLGVEHYESEGTVASENLAGQCDLHGLDRLGRHWVFEIKTTQGDYIFPPRPSEIIQMSLYASLLKVEDPIVACIRLNLKTRKIGVFVSRETQKLVQMASELIRDAA